VVTTSKLADKCKLYQSTLVANAGAVRDRYRDCDDGGQQP
jgi:hypothetical protein